MNCKYCQTQCYELNVEHPDLHIWSCLSCGDNITFTTVKKDGSFLATRIYFQYRDSQYTYCEVYDPVWHQEKGMHAYFADDKLIITFQEFPKITPKNVLNKFLTYKNFS